MLDHRVCGGRGGRRARRAFGVSLPEQARPGEGSRLLDYMQATSSNRVQLCMKSRHPPNILPQPWPVANASRNGTVVRARCGIRWKRSISTTTTSLSLSMTKGSFAPCAETSWHSGGNARTCRSSRPSSRSRPTTTAAQCNPRRNEKTMIREPDTNVRGVLVCPAR